LFATFVANRFWETPLPKRYATGNSFFEHLGLVGGFILVAWYGRCSGNSVLRGSGSEPERVDLVLWLD
jgi:uncharacterized membrane protein YphA (DoxX/SURF4 family)